jgi:hypothetical protein
MPPDPPRMSHAFGASLHDHSHDAGFATEQRSFGIKMFMPGVLALRVGNSSYRLNFDLGKKNKIHHKS